MKYTKIILFSLLTSSCIHAKSFNTTEYLTKDKTYAATIKLTKNLNVFFEKEVQPKVKPTLATTSVAAGTYWLIDTIKTSIDMQGQPQQNGEKGIALNAVLAATLIGCGSYLFKVWWDENKDLSKN